MQFEETVLDPGTAAVLRSLGPILANENFYLAGGTSLAIQIGHRLSIDLDFFRREEFPNERILEKVSARFPDTTIVSKSANTLHLRIEGVKVDIIRYPYPMLEGLVNGPNVPLASIPDIIAMKLSAVANRGSKKDFFDLYELGNTFSLSEMIDLYSRKFPNHDSFIVLRSLCYFEDAELEPDPISLRKTEWNTVKEYFRFEVKSMTR